MHFATIFRVDVRQQKARRNMLLENRSLLLLAGGVALAAPIAYFVHKHLIASGRKGSVPSMATVPAPAETDWVPVADVLSCFELNFHAFPARGCVSVCACRVLA